jgi:osmoprotectant transport system substrate-binding protein
VHRRRRWRPRARAPAADRAQPANAERPALIIGSKGFTEQLILAEIYVQALRAAGYRASSRTAEGSERAAYTELRGNGIHAYPEYTGTALTSLYRESPEEVPRDGQQAYEQPAAGSPPTGWPLCRRPRSATPTASPCARRTPPGWG